MVSNTNDTGPGSLRSALSSVVPGPVTFAPGLTGTIVLTNGELRIGSDTTVIGPGRSNITVSGYMLSTNASRVLEIARGNVSLAGLTIANGNVTNVSGGGILNAGNLTMNGCTVSQNSVHGGDGGGLYNTGSLTVSN